MAAGLAPVPAGEHTWIKQRVEHEAAQGRIKDLNAAERGSVADGDRSSGPEESLWLCPIEDRRRVNFRREGMVEGFFLGNYLLLVDYTAWLFRKETARVSREPAGLFSGLRSDAESWQARPLKLSEGRLLGRFFAASRRRLRDAAEHLGVYHLANLVRCPAR